MILFKQISAIRNQLGAYKNEGKTVGFVPTMGALHQGHLSLIQQSRQQNDITVCSIFVNPTQFNDPQDFAKYPVTIEKDILLLEQQDTDILFLPAVSEIYPNGLTQLPHYDLGFIETVLEGAYRPGHFQGVCQVVHKLLQIVEPGKLYMGQKDFQQCLVIQKLISLFNIPTQLVIEPTYREADGLAMSSRNMRLTTEARAIAPSLFKALNEIKKSLPGGDLPGIKRAAIEKIISAGFDRVDYVEIADSATLASLNEWNADKNAVILTAAFLNGVRLIDNLLVQG